MPQPLNKAEFQAQDRQQFPRLSRARSSVGNSSSIQGKRQLQAAVAVHICFHRAAALAMLLHSHSSSIHLSQHLSLT